LARANTLYSSIFYNICALAAPSVFIVEIFEERTGASRRLLQIFDLGLRVRNLPNIAGRFLQPVQRQKKNLLGGRFWNYIAHENLSLGLGVEAQQSAFRTSFHSTSSTQIYLTQH
jgi:hypothetical protein